MNFCRIFLFAFVYQLTAIATLAYKRVKPHTKCVRTYTKLGCFLSNKKPLKEFLISDRNPGTDGHKLNWNEWEESIHSLACRCAEATRKKGYKVFGLQNYGECWSGPGAEKTYHLNDPSSECIMILQKPPPPCDINDPRECMGIPHVNYMYKLDEDECSKSPCKNGGTCTNTPGGFRCTCSQGFKGDSCDQDEDECVNSPCKNGGTCTNTPGDFTCTCTQGFQGKLCDQDINECNSRPCKNGGSCINTPGHYLCKCIPGYTGAHCEQDVDECQTGPCRNGGSCVNNMGSFHCMCPPGIKGKLCEQDVNECVPVNPCKNGAHCVNKHGGFHCLCPAGITGTLCEIDVDECQQHVCLNGATCVNTVGSFHCRCMSGYGGGYCEKKACSKSDQYDLGLVIDGSGSVGNLGFTAIKRFLLHLIDEFPVNAEGTHFGMIVYSSDATIIVRFSNQWYHDPVNLKMKVLFTEFPDGDTRTDKALKMAGTELYKAGEDRDQVPNVLVVITDGNTAQGSVPYKDVLKPLKDHDVDIIAVGIGGKVSTAELTEIAMGNNDRVIQVDKSEDLNINELSEMIKSIC